MPAVRGNELATIVNTAGMEPQSAQALVDAFTPLFLRMEDAVADGMMIKVTSADEEDTIEAATQAHKNVRDIRLQAEANRKKFKENALRTGQAIDKIAKIIFEKIEPVEAHLLAQKNFVKELEAKRKADLAELRAAKLTAVNADPTAYPLGEMSQDAFDNLLQGATLTNQKRIDDAAKAESDRLAAEQERTAREAATRAENERLRLEQKKADADLQAARDTAAKAIADKNKADAEAKGIRDAETKRIADEAFAASKKAAEEKAAEAKAAAAPDKQKILTFARLIRGTVIPQVNSPEAAAITAKINLWIGMLADRIETDANKL